MEQVDLTVLMTARNQAEVLPTALAHLELQNYPSARFEVLVADAASVDDTAGIVERYAGGAPVATRCIRHHSASLVAARNQGVEQARGRVVLFLDPDLLAGPALVEQHLQAHTRHGERSCVVGNIAAHPQLAGDSFIPWRNLEPKQHLRNNMALHFLDWRGQNMSLPLADLLGDGRFDEAFIFPYFSDAELAWRLSLKGIRGHFEDSAIAYVWRPSTLERERSHYYARGYSLHTLAQKTHSKEVLRRYPPESNRLAQWIASFTAGAGARLCEFLDQDTHLFRELYGHVLHHEFRQGYTDALRGKSPRPDLNHA